MYSTARRLLFALDPETAHRLSILYLKSGLPPAFPKLQDRRLRIVAAGLEFPNPLGLAAGYDKDGEVIDASLNLGFGFVEIGSVTPHPQPGNPRPRIFRLERDRAIINRLGFNNRGHAACLERLRARTGRDGIVGVNIGANKDSDDRILDYVKGVEAFGATASYLTVNISSPNTPGLRQLQAPEQLAELLAAVTEARQKQAPAVPVFLKISPDLEENDLNSIADRAEHYGIDGLIVSNTTLSRKALIESGLAGEAGGLSGTPLFDRSTTVLAKMRQCVGPDFVLIGAGGIDSGDTALEKIRAGADLLQLYTGLVYGGPSLPSRIVRALADHAEREGLKSIREIRDSSTKKWAARPIG